MHANRTATGALPTTNGGEPPRRRLVLDVDGQGLDLLGRESDPALANLRVVAFRTRAAEHVDVPDDVCPAVRGRLDRLPFADASVDIVTVAGTLEHVVADDDALDECARVLRSGGLLFLRVPQDDRLAWLDAQNLYTYLSGTSHRGKPLAGRPALRFRRHYGAAELHSELEARRFRIRTLTTEGLGIGEALMLIALLTSRWALKSEGLEHRARSRLAPILAAERRLRTGSWGRDLVVIAERRPRTPSEAPT